MHAVRLPPTRRVSGWPPTLQASIANCAARPEPAAVGPRADRRRFAGDRHEVLAALGHPEPGMEQRVRVRDDAGGSGCGRTCRARRSRRRTSSSPARTGTRRPRGRARRGSRPIPSCVAQLADEHEDLVLDGHVEGGRRLVEDEERRAERERGGDHHPLAHPARQLMRPLLQDRVRARDLHEVEQSPRLGPCLGLRHLAATQVKRLEQLRLDRQDRVEARPASSAGRTRRPGRGSDASPSRRAWLMSCPAIVSRPPVIASAIPRRASR